MQRCPYIHEMRERLLGQPNESAPPMAMDREEIMDRRQNMESNQVGTVVKVGAIARCIILQVELSAFNPHMYLSEHFNTSTTTL